MHSRYFVFFWSLLWAAGFTWLLGASASAAPSKTEVFQAPIGGKAFEVGDERVVCALSEGWTTEGGGKLLRPPQTDQAVGKRSSIRLGKSVADCERAGILAEVVALAAWPIVDSSSVVFSVDEARLEARGKRLAGAQLVWKSASATGVDGCEPSAEPAGERCVWLTGRDLSADPSAPQFFVVPAGGRVEKGATFFDADGRALGAQGQPLEPAKVILSQLLPPDSTVDLATGRGEIQVLHPEVVAATECSAIDCSVSGGKIIAASTASTVGSTDVRFRLLPHVVLRRAGNLESQPLFKVTLVRCAMTVFGPVLRAERARAVVRLDERCARDAGSYRFLLGNTPVPVVRQVPVDGGVAVVIEVGLRTEDDLSLVAVRESGALIASVHATVVAPPVVRARLELPSYPRIDFVPNNRPALVHVPKLPGGLYLALVPVEGVYLARSAEKQTFIQGDVAADGLIALRFAVRSNALPEALQDLDLGFVSDALQRPIHEANVPVPLSDVGQEEEGWIEFMCGPNGRPTIVHPGDPINIPFEFRDTCRVVFHREKLANESGEQRIAVSIDVFSTEGATRSDGQVRETLTLRAASRPRLLWVRGITNPFDRVVVRIAHDQEETHYVKGSRTGSAGPAIQWSCVLGTGLLRLYATTAIPTGLYRFGGKSHSGPLSLNFGVISRLTFLMNDGHEWLLGVEGGVMVLGLAGSTSTTGQSLTQIGAVTGLGLSVPIANRNSAAQASINLHGWVEFPFGEAIDHRPAFIFGPSISLGNVGATL